MISKLNRATLAALAKNVAKNWSTYFSTYQVKHTDYNTLGAQAAAFGDMVKLNNQQKGTKKENTVGLAAVNQKIEAALSDLKKLLRVAFAPQKDLSAVYLPYGIERQGNKSSYYGLPTANNSRQTALETIVAQLQQTAHPYLNNPTMIQLWEDLQTEHLLAWEDSLRLRSVKSDCVLDVAQTYQQIQRTLEQLYAQIKFDFEDTGNVFNILRQFGFLRDIF